MNDKKRLSSNQKCLQLSDMQVNVYLLERLCGSKLFFYTNFAILGAPTQMVSKKWKSVKVRVTLGFLHKLIKRCNLVSAGHKHDLLLEIFGYGVYQNNNSQPEQTHNWMDLLAITELQHRGSTRKMKAGI